MTQNKTVAHCTGILATLIEFWLLTGCNSSGGVSGSSVVPPTISSTSLPIADVTMPYGATLAASGTSEIKWTIVNGVLPPGLTLLESGVIEGAPAVAGNWAISITAMSPAGNDTKTFTLIVRPKTSSVTAAISGTKSNGASGIYPTYGAESSLSGDGRYVIFQSEASNLVLGDTNGKRDLFIQDRQSGEIARISIGNGGSEADGDTVGGAISEDGNVVAYQSLASNLVPGDTNSGAPGGGGADIFVYDRVKNETSRVSLVSLTGTEGTCSTPPTGGVRCNSFDPQLNLDGNLIVFGSLFTNLVSSDTNNVADIFLHDRTTKATERLSVGPGGLESDGVSGNPGISADGRYVIFESTATNLVGAGNDTNGVSDIFVHDRTTHQTVRVSVGVGGIESNGHSFTPSISRDGRYIAFWSYADNLVANDTNGVADVFVVDWQSPTPTMRRLSVDANGIEGNAESRVPVLSRDGRYVVFESDASNLLGVGGDSNGLTDIYVADLQGIGADAIKRVSVGETGGEALGGPSVTPSISADGRFVSFASEAVNLESGDSNGVADVFVAQRP